MASADAISATERRDQTAHVATAGRARLMPHWLPTGWFQFGWSRGFPAGQVRPLRYFGKDLVAYRAEDGALHVLDAHCRHLGAHLGYGGEVKGDCIVCPFHGWHWDPQGRNRYIPYQEDRPNKARRLKSWHVHEHAGVAYLWHDLIGSAPAWPVPDVFSDTADHTVALSYHESGFEGQISYGQLTLHPQLVAENAADPIHFRYVHRTKDHPVFLRRWERNELWYSRIGFGKRWVEMEPESHDGDTLSILLAGVGLSYTSLSGSSNTLILLATTPIDDSTSELFQTVWLERLQGDDAPGVLQSRLTTATAQLPNDIQIWQHQRFEDPPALATREGRAYTDLRLWARQFYPTGHGARLLAGSV
jgi:3-ketosteroid 9alpha-monooxygenase subunit A